ncbi:hypothetical protein SAMD00023353_2100590 [Rosellinia necatrix]|uniref:Uncharacterized protein n=1 Tax=Rosellinia necatrix TaxID=77044 RepID=A0A1S8A7W3_ROSNE|nr:hypothetical protein SAMD00023353_2100590 [Rosellinia necatrix]
MVLVLFQTLAAPRELPQRPDSPVSRGARDLTSEDSADYPPSRYEDIKGTNAMSISVFATKKEAARGIRRNGDGTFPPISKPMAAASDINGNPVQDRLFTSSFDLAPTLSAVPPVPESWGIIRSASGRMKAGPKPKTKPGKLAISQPILNDDENLQTSLNKIPTIDLAEAASNDRIRRENYVRRMSNLIAQRPAPRPPSPRAAPNTMARELERSESTKSDKSSSGLSVEANASSTATQLSPGVDAIRRRSPRQPRPAALSTPFKVIRPGEPIRIPIPRPLEPEQDLPPEKSEPVKTPLQRRPTTGLPSNPRAQTLKTLTKENGDQKTQTVMFVNNIVYNNPDAVGDIIQGATKIPQPPGSGESVVNRPRPIPRGGDKDRQVFPAEVSPNNQHRRTKSGGSVMSRKSILQSVPGTPTGLPSLPPIPSMTGLMGRPVPNSTKSMTVEEKMNLLYLPPSSPASTTEPNVRRRSSVPNLPFVPITQEEQAQPRADSLSNSESNDDMRASKASKRTTARTSSLLGITPGPQAITQSDDLMASSSNRDELGSSWLLGTRPDTRADDLEMPGEMKRRSSPVLPAEGRMSMSTFRSETRSGDEETITNWGSVHSPAVPVPRQNARSTYIWKYPRNELSTEEIPIIMVDESLRGPANDGVLSDPEGGKSPSGNLDDSRHLSGQFHHRVGDDCPTFSARKDKPRPRKMPPPTPLLLSGRTTKRQIIVQPVEPSPIESPRVAYEVIQSQLRNFEQLDGVLVESPGQRSALLANLEQEMGQLESKWQSNHNHLGRDSMSSIRTSPSRYSRPASTALPLPGLSSRRSSIASAIAERRASRRARMQNGSGEGTPASSARNLSQSPENVLGAVGQTGLAEAHVYYIENAPGLLVKRNNLSSSPGAKGARDKPGSLDPLAVDLPRLNEEPEGDSETSDLETPRPVVPGRGLWSRNLSTQESPNSHLWDPQIRVSMKQNQSHELPGLSIRPATRKHLNELKIESSRLWQSSSTQTPIAGREGLWEHPASPQRSVSIKALTRPVTIRPPRKNKRVTLLPDIIENPEPLPDKRGTLGIFQFPWGEKSENATLPYDQTQAFMAMSETLTAGHFVMNPTVDPRVTQLEATEYSSSFFDEYDEEEEGDNFSDFSSSGDDDFDETTLWEIASLLQSDQVPSKDSLLPMQMQSSPSLDASLLEEYMTDIPSDEDYEDSHMVDTAIFSERIEAEGRAVSNHNVSNLLWEPRQPASDHNQGYGLPQHEDFSGNQHVTDLTKRTKPRRLIEGLEFTQSTQLWSPVTRKTEKPKSSFLWTVSEDASKLRETSTVRSAPTLDRGLGLWAKPENIKPHTLGLPEPEAQAWHQSISQNKVMNRSRSRTEIPLLKIESSMLWRSKAPDAVMLWTRSPPSPAFKTRGLFTPGVSRVNYRTTANPPAAILLPRRVPRHNTEPLESIMSTALWSPLNSIPINAPTGLWTSNIDEPLVPISKAPSTPAGVDASPSSLWKSPVQVQVSVSCGLFDPKTTRRDYRRTSKLPIVISPSKTSRVVREQALSLTSFHLWTPQRVHITVVRDLRSGYLWQRMQPANAMAPILFKLDLERTDYRNTSADPAALVMVRKPRATRQSLRPIQSTQLWTKSQVVSIKIDWITKCASPAAGPSLQLSGASSVPSLSIDTVSVKTSAVTTPTSTPPSKDKGGFFSGWFGKKTKKDSITAAAPEAPVDAITSIRDLHGLPEGIVIKNLDNVPRAKPAHIPLRHRHRSTVAYNANWEIALAEAIAAGYPQDWDGQLDEAPAASEASQFLTYDVTTRHPAFFGSLKTAAQIVHPALTGYRVGVIHPAKEEFVTQRQGSPLNASALPRTSSLWAMPSEPQGALANGLWAHRSEVDSRFELVFKHMQGNDPAVRYPVGRNGATRLLGPDTEIDFGKQGLWKRGNGDGRLQHSSSLQKNWLETL